MATVSVRIDDDLKRDAESVFSDIGLSLSAAITVYFKQVVRERAVPFALKAPSTGIVPTDAFAEQLIEIEDDISAGKNISPPLSGEQLMEHLGTLHNAV